MPRYNVNYNGKWACFTTIVDGFITSFMDKADYEEWRLEEYGKADYKPAEQCNMYTMEDAVSSASLNHSKESVIKNLTIVAGLSESEAEELWNKYKIDPEEEDEEWEDEENMRQEVIIQLKKEKFEEFYKIIDDMTESEGFKKLCAEMGVPEYMVKLTPEELKESPHMALALFYALTREI